MPSNEPASYQLTSAYSNQQTRYKILRSKDNLIYLENDSCQSLTVGQRLNLQGLTYALVIAVNEVEATARVTKITNAQYATLGDWTNLTQPTSMLLIPEEQAGRLFVRCDNALTEKPGFIGWSLFNSDNVLLAIGNDYQSHNICQIEGTGSWAAGSYILEVRSFLPDSLQPINFATKTWELAEPTARLSTGSVNDIDTKLILS